MTKRYRELDLLHPDFRALVCLFLARCVERQIPVILVETWRSEAAHQEDVKNGKSWIKKSKHQHILQRKLGDATIETPASLAIDVAPFETFELHGPDKLQWDADDPVWQELGLIGEHTGMKWGGRWKQKDMGHFQAPWA